MRLILKLAPIFAVLLAWPLSTFAGSCQKLDCDCKSIPNSDYKSSCLIHEQMLRETCVNVHADVRGYCSVHGKDAFPVAVSLAVMDVSPSQDIDASNRKIASLYWSLRQDANFSLGSLKENDYVNAKAILKIAVRNASSLFKTQLEVSEFWESKDNPRKAKKAWKSYTSDTTDIANHWKKYLSKVTEMLDSPDISIVERKHLVELIEQISNLSALGFEQAGYAFGRAGKHGRAAQSWKAAAKVSSSLIDVLEKNGSPDEQVSQYRLNTAARYNRASFYWLMNENEVDAEEQAQRAQQYASEKLLNELLTNADDPS